MKLETAKMIENAAEVMGVDLQVRKDYSGRGMYGKTTTGIVGSRTDILKAAVYAAYEIGRDYTEDGVNIDDFIDDINFRWDSMGHDDIAY